MMQKGNGKGPVYGQPDGERMLLMLDNLTAQGYDVSDIRTAVTTGDFKTAHTLMQEFRTANPDAFPSLANGTSRGPVTGQVPGERILGMLDNLTAKGYDVTAIRTAAESGNYTTAMTLLREFRTANPDAFPACANGAGAGTRAGSGGHKTTNNLSDSDVSIPFHYFYTCMVTKCTCRATSNVCLFFPDFFL